MNFLSDFVLQSKLEIRGQWIINLSSICEKNFKKSSVFYIELLPQKIFNHLHKAHEYTVSDITHIM